MSEIHDHVQHMIKMLRNVGRWLDKAEAHAKAKNYDPDVLLQSRLAPDMYPLVNQIQAACDNAKFLAARLAGREPPKHPDTEKTFEEVRARLKSVLDYLATFGPSDFQGWETRMVALGFFPGKGLVGADYLREFNLPNALFHLTVAYAILRHNGIELGKTDYVGGLRFRDL